MEADRLLVPGVFRWRQKTVFCHDFIRKFPKDYDTVVMIGAAIYPVGNARESRWPGRLQQKCTKKEDKKSVLLGAVIGDIAGSRFEFRNYKKKTGYHLMTGKCFFTDDSVMLIAVAKAMMESAPSFFNLAENAVSDMQQLGRRYPDAGYGSVPQALEAFFESLDFGDVIRNAISIGGDSDTIAAICRSIAGSYYGIPQELEEQTLTYQI